MPVVRSTATTLTRAAFERHDALQMIADSAHIYREEAANRPFFEIRVEVIELGDRFADMLPSGSLTVVTGRADSSAMTALLRLADIASAEEAVEAFAAVGQCTTDQTSDAVSIPNTARSIPLLTQLTYSGEKFFEPIPTDLSNTDVSMVVLPFLGGSIADTQFHARYHPSEANASASVKTVILVRQPQLSTLERLVGAAIPDEALESPIKWHETIRCIGPLGALAATVGAGLLVAGAGYAVYRTMNRTEYIPTERYTVDLERRLEEKGIDLPSGLGHHSNLSDLLEARAEVIGAGLLA